MPEEFIGCQLKQLPESMAVAAAQLAIDHNPANRPPAFRLIELAEYTCIALVGGKAKAKKEAPEIAVPGRLAVMTTKYWGAGGVKLTVGFPFDSTPADLQARILLHMNAWGEFCNVQFKLTATDPQVRIARNDDGYWSYLGVDVLSIPRNQPTMNLQGFTMSTSEAEFRRVVRHETGHTLGFPHEHMRPELVQRIDPEKAYDYFWRTQRWSKQVTKQQVLTSLSESSIMGTTHADEDSSMCYQLPGSITKDGQPIRGGADINATDGAFANKLYPKAVVPPPPPPPPPPPTTGRTITLAGGTLASGTYTLT